MELGNGFKQTEVGIIPNDWDVVDLFELADRKKALFDDGDWIESEHITDEGIRLIQTGNIGIGSYVEKNLKKYIYTSSFEILKCKELQIGDLLICRLAEPAGRSCILPKLEDNRIVTSVDVTIFRPLLNKANRRFLNQIFATRRWLENVSENSGGTTHKRISRGRLAKLFIQLPSIIEQDKIASALCDADELTKSLEKLIEKKKNIKQGAMQQLLKPKMGWEDKRLGDIVIYKNGKAHENCVVDNGEYVIVNSKFISTDGNIAKYSNSQLCPVSKNEILMVLSDIPNGKAIAKCFLVEKDNKYTLNQRICSLKSIKTDPFFLFYLLNRNPYFLSFDDGAKQTNLRNIDVLNCPLTIPSNIEEQIMISNILSDMDSEISLLEERLTKAQLIKQGMMQNLLTGKIRLVCQK